MNILHTFKQSLLTTLFLMIACGLLYPLVTTAIGQVIFPHQANGSLIKSHQTVIGSELIGQPFSSPQYLHPRPSAVNYSTGDNAPSSGGSNYSQQNKVYKQRLAKDIEAFSKENNVPKNQVPSSIVTASGSGLDGYITKEAAVMQMDRIMSHSHLSKEKLNTIINKHTIDSGGQSIVNVLLVNIDIKNRMH